MIGIHLVFEAVHHLTWPEFLFLIAGWWAFEKTMDLLLAFLFGHRKDLP